MVKSADFARDRKSTRLNSSHTEIYTLSLHDALPIWNAALAGARQHVGLARKARERLAVTHENGEVGRLRQRSEEHTSELQSHRDLHSFPTRRSSDLECRAGRCAAARRPCPKSARTACGHARKW